jgi:hypothetical protein
MATEVFTCTMWTTWCGGSKSDKCKKCGSEYINPSYEMNVSDNGEERYLSEVCLNCAQKFYEADPDTATAFKENKPCIQSIMNAGLVSQEFIKLHYTQQKTEI